MPKSTYKYWKCQLQKPDKDQGIKELILDIKSNNKDFGYRRVTAKLQKAGMTINKKKVQRLMNEMNVKVTSYTRKSRKYYSFRGEVGKIAPNVLNREFDTGILHEKIVTDTTEFKYESINENGTKEIKKCYLDPFMDLYNREIVSYSIGQRPSSNNVLSALMSAIIVTNDCEKQRIFHSDQGWAYQMKKYVKILEDTDIVQSMSRRGNCHDNSVMENFFGMMKQEMYYGHTYTSFEDLKEAIIKYIKYYNEDRIKEKLGWMSPIEYRLSNSF